MVTSTEDSTENQQNWRLHAPKNVRWHLAQAINGYRHEDRDDIDHQFYRTLATLLRLQLDILKAEKDGELLVRLEDLERQVSRLRGLQVA